jgi:diguanylate cyclase (GGDEF)-like protein
MGFLAALTVTTADRHNSVCGDATESTRRRQIGATMARDWLTRVSERVTFLSQAKNARYNRGRRGVSPTAQTLREHGSTGGRDPMKLLMPTKKTSLKTQPIAMAATDAADLEAEIARLARQNTSLKRAIARLQVYRAMAYRDPLTGLWNRRYFEERLKEEFSRSRRAGAGRRFSVAIIDINGFKEINDEHGHQAGDTLLKWVGEFLVAHLRTHDVACRTGGDEFMLLLPDLSEADCAPVIARLRDQLRLANIDRQIPVSLSIGSASWPQVSDSCERILETADAAMYADKRAQKSAHGSAPRTSSMTRTGRHRIASVG